MFTENQVSPERPPIVGYTGHIPGAKGESALSRRYAQAARRGLQMLQREREGRSSREKESSSLRRPVNGRIYDETWKSSTRTINFYRSSVQNYEIVPWSNRKYYLPVKNRFYERDSLISRKCFGARNIFDEKASRKCSTRENFSSKSRRSRTF